MSKNEKHWFTHFALLVLLLAALLGWRYDVKQAEELFELGGMVRYAQGYDDASHLRPPSPSVKGVNEFIEARRTAGTMPPAARPPRLVREPELASDGHPLMPR
jgi:hypothetical protein